MIKVSVLIPAYNVELYIRECLDSVLNQTLQDFEIICIDDASTDQTLAILNLYAAQDDRIRVFCHKENLGQSAGRNLALSKAAGEYVYFLDADDMIEPFALEELYQRSSRDGLDVIGFETCQFLENPELMDRAPAQMIEYDNTKVLDGREALCYCMDREVFSLSTPTFFIRRAYLQETGLRFVEGILHEDVGYLFELISRAERICFVHKIYFLRRVRAKSTMTVGFTDKNIEGYLKSFYKSFELEGLLTPYYRENPEFLAAVQKWRREIYWRIRQLYEGSLNHIIAREGGLVSEEIRRAFEMLKLSLGGLPTEEVPDVEEVYLCGTGSYTQRAIMLLGQKDTIIRGILVPRKEKKAFRGFPLYLPEEIPDKTIPVLMSVSRYSRDWYEEELEKNGIWNRISMKF